MSCNGLVLCSNQGVISNISADLSIFERCYNNIIYGKINIHVSLQPIYVSEGWDYSKTIAENIKKWYVILVGIKLSIVGKVELLNKTYFCDNHQCPWMTDNIKRD